MATIKLNKSEQWVLGRVRRDGYFTTDPGRGKRLNTAAYSLVKKGVCKITQRDEVTYEDRHYIPGWGTEYSRHRFSTIRVALADAVSQIVESGPEVRVTVA